MNNVLVTGALGYIGNEVIRVLLKRHFNVIANDWCPIAVERYFPIWHDKITYIHEDVCDLKCPQNVDLVVHLAASVGYVSCDKQSSRAEKTNIVGTKNVASFKKPTLFFSTGSVYGNLDGLCVETSPCSPQTLYSRTKLEGESIIKDTECCIVRPATAYGISYKTRHDLLPHTMARLAQTGSIDLYQPDAVRTLYHVRKIAEFVGYCADNWSQFSGETFNLGTESGTMSKREMVEKLQRHTKFDVNYVDGTDPDGRDYQVSYEKLHKVWDDNFDCFDDHLKSLTRYYALQTAVYRSSSI